MKMFGVITETKATEHGIEASMIIPYAEADKTEKRQHEIDYYNWAIRGLRTDACMIEQTIDPREPAEEKKNDKKDITEPD